MDAIFLVLMLFLKVLDPALLHNQGKGRFILSTAVYVKWLQNIGVILEHIWKSTECLEIILNGMNFETKV